MIEALEMSFGLDAGGNVRTLPMQWVSALPGSGSFESEFYYDLTAHGWFYWDGSSFVGPLGAGGGGGGAPTNATYLVASADATLTQERVIQDSATIDWDLGTPSVVQAHVFDDSITNAKLRNGVARSVIGRAGNTTGDPADIAAVSGSDEVLREFAGDIGFGKIKTNGIDAQAVETNNIKNKNVTYGKIQDTTAPSILIGRGAAGGGTVQEIGLGPGLAITGTTLDTTGGGGGAPVGAQYVVMALDGTLTSERVLAVGASLTLVDGGANGNATLTRSALTGDVTAAANSNATTIANDAVTNAKAANMAHQTFKARVTAGTGDPEDVLFAGTSFPSSPADGQPFYRTDHRVAYHFSSTAAAWLSDHVHEFLFGQAATQNATTYCRMDRLMSAAAYTDTSGWRYAHAVVVVGMEVTINNGIGSHTATWTVQDDGANVTNGALALSAQNNKQDDAMLSSVIAAGSCIGVKVTAGSATNNHHGRVRLRRRET